MYDIGDKVQDFVEELARQVCDMSKEDQQKSAGSLIRSLIKSEFVSKDLVSFTYVF